MTDDRPGSASLPPDPAEYDSPRARIARAKGLDQPYIAGGRDPDPGPALEADRHYGKLLLLMVASLMFGGFVIGIVLTIATGGRLL
ncbi:MAG: hypothetical protein E4H24_01480 [Thermomicrobiales bacterium]|jgi:hypothetical protein|nr:MAG: hypothetical protein E4H24_01480 [Thermomicrobiales bacterium]